MDHVLGTVHIMGNLSYLKTVDHQSVHKNL